MTRAITILGKTVATILVVVAIGFAVLVTYHEITTSPFGYPPASAWRFK